MAIPCITPDCKIGVGTVVWQFASVIRGSVVGDNCSIGSNAMVDASVVGDGCRISHGAFLCPGVRLERNVFIGPYVMFCNDRWPRVSQEGFDMPALLNGSVQIAVIEEEASIGAGAVILPGVRIGKQAMVAAGAVVERDVSPGWLLTRDGKSFPIDPARKDRLRAVCRVLPVAAE